jgi:hypothetical protein
MVKMDWNPEDEARFRGITEGCLGGVLAAVIFILAIIMFMTGCATCPPCQPKVETVEVKVPVYSCPEPPKLPETLLVQYPSLPETPSDQDWKNWYAEMVATVKARHDALQIRVLLLERILDQYKTNTDDSND